MQRLVIVVGLVLVLIFPLAFSAQAWQAGNVNALVWSPDGTQLATGNTDGTVQIWDAASGTVLQVLSGHSASVVSVAWRGDRLASGGLDNQIYIWKMPSGEIEQLIADHTDDVWNLSWSPNATWLASVSGDGAVGLWGAGSSLIQGAHSAPAYALAWSPSGDRVATGAYDGVVNIWQVDGTLVTALNSQITQINVLGWGNRLVVAGESNQLEIWDMGTETATLLPVNAPVYSLSFHPDGERFALGDQAGRISLYNIQGEFLTEFTGHTSVITGLSFSPDGTRLASSSSDQQIMIWEIH